MTVGSNIHWTEAKPGEPGSVSARGLNALAETVRRLAAAMPGGPGMVGPFGALTKDPSSLSVAWLKVLDDSPNDDGLWRCQVTKRNAGGTDREWTDPEIDDDEVDQVWGESPDDDDFLGRTHWLLKGRRIPAVLSGSQTATPFGGGSDLTLPLYTIVAGDLITVLKVTDDMPGGTPSRFEAVFQEDGSTEALIEPLEEYQGDLDDVAENDLWAGILWDAEGTKPVFRCWPLPAPAGLTVKQSDGGGDVVTKVREIRTDGIDVEELAPGVAKLTASGGGGGGGGSGTGGAFNYWDYERPAAGSQAYFEHDLSGADVRGKLIQVLLFQVAETVSGADDKCWLPGQGAPGGGGNYYSASGGPQDYNGVTRGSGTGGLFCNETGEPFPPGRFDVVSPTAVLSPGGGAGIIVDDSDGHLKFVILAFAGFVDSTNVIIVWRVVGP